MSKYKNKDMLKAVTGDLLDDTIDYDHEIGEPLNIEEVDARWKSIRDEIDEVYRKSEAFDEVMDLYVNGSNKYLQTKRHTLDVFIEDVAEILKPFTDKYESGETNV